MTVKAETLNAQVRITLDFTAWLMMYLRVRRWAQHQVSRIVTAYMMIVGAVVAGIRYARSSPSLFAAWILREKALAVAHIQAQAHAAKNVYIARKETCRAALVAAVAGRELMELRAQIAALENMIQTIPTTKPQARSKPTSRRESMRAELNSNTLSIGSKELEEAAKTVSRVIHPNCQSPILRGVRIQSTKKAITISGTDLEAAASINIPVVGDGLFDCVVQAKELLTVLKSFKGKLSLRCLENACVVSDGTSTVSLVIMDASEFPAMPTLENPTTYVFPSLAESLANVVFAAATDKNKPYLANVCFRGSDIVATDTFRLACVTSPVMVDRDILIPARIASEVARAFKGQTVTVKVANSYAAFEAGNTTIYARLVDAQFPAYERVIPRESQSRIMVDAASMLNRIPTLLKDEFGSVALSASGNTLTITSKSPDVAESTATCPATLDGEPFTVSLRAIYLRPVLDRCKNITLAYTGATSPVIIQEEGKLYLIMPVTRNE